MSGNKQASTDHAAGEAASLAAALEAAAIAERAGQTHGALGRVLKDALPAIRANAVSAPRGDQAVSRLAKSFDEIIKTIFSLSGAPREDFAVCAIGGYGRRELAPYSDIDLLFLHQGGEEAKLHELMDFMLYALWDSDLKIGHGVHTPKTAVAFAGEDIIARTAYLDARIICGSRKIYDDFASRYDRLRRKTKNQFVAAKLKEQDERQERTGETRYLVEPDIKDGKGGLRDLQTIRWIYKYVYGPAMGEKGGDGKALEPGDLSAIRKAERFLFSIRVQLHDIRGRADDVLGFDVQPQIASRLEYADRSDMSAAERLMKHYFVNSVEVGRLTRILCARLEEERTKRLPNWPTGLPKALQSDEAPGKPNIKLRNGRLDFDRPASARARPRDFFRLFRAASKKPDLDFHPRALALISSMNAAITSDVREDPVTAKVFAGILMDAKEPLRILRVMTETGLLGKYIPTFGKIVGRIDYGLYRRYTIDEHILRCVNLLTQIKSGALSDDHPLAEKIVKSAKSPLSFYLAVLLHETRWALKNKSPENCEKRIARISARLGLDEENASLVAWAGARHLLMVRTAERRDLADAHAIAAFAETVGSAERLDLMLVLSVCHLRVVGVQSWDLVTRRRLAALYEASRIWLEDGGAALRKSLSNRATAARKKAKEDLSDWPAAAQDEFLSRLTNSMLRSLETDVIVRFARLVRAAESNASNAAVTVTPRDGDLEAIIYADDRVGLLADLAGVVAEKGLSVRSVQAVTTQDGKALDIFAIQSADGELLNDPARVRRLHRALLAVAEAPPEEPLQPQRRIGDRRQLFKVAPVVRFEQDAAEDATVIETEGLDRPGLLYELAAALARLDTEIISAHIATYGERAVDAFYLQDRAGRKIVDEVKLERIRAALTDVLAAGANE